MTLAFIIAILIWGFAIGGLARFAIPGPDPMPIWMTTAIGIGGALIGGIISRLLFGPPTRFFFSLLCARPPLVLFPQDVPPPPPLGGGAPPPPPGLGCSAVSSF